MTTEPGEQPSASTLPGPLDVIAYAGWEVLGAASVAVVVGQRSAQNGEDSDATVRGWCSPARNALDGRRLVLAPEIPVGIVTWVDLEDRPDGSARLSMPGPDHSGRAAMNGPRQVLRGRTVDQLDIAIVVERPSRNPRKGTIRSLKALLDAIANSVTVERSTFQQRLRFGLQEREEERRRWARELHDETLQQMGALHVLLTALMRSTEVTAAGHDTLLEALPTATEMLNRQINSLRHLITELRPAALDELGLSAPLHALARRTEDLTGLSVTVQVSLRYAAGQLATRLLPDIEVAVYRVVQEAVTNACRHSSGTQVQVSVVEDDQEVHVEVRDNGNGIPRVSGAPGFGIIGMQERAMLAGGRLEVLSGPNDGSANTHRGTVIRLVVPATHRSHPQSTPTTEPGEPTGSELTSSALNLGRLPRGDLQRRRLKLSQSLPTTHAETTSPDRQESETRSPARPLSFMGMPLTKYFARGGGPTRPR